MKMNTSRNEWQILHVLWQMEEATAREIHEALGEAKAYTTIQTYLERMTEKGLLEKRKIGPVNVYKAKIQRSEIVDDSLHAIVQNAFGGSYRGLVNFLFDSTKLNKSDLEDIRRIITEKEQHHGE